MLFSKNFKEIELFAYKQATPKLIKVVEYLKHRVEGLQILYNVENVEVIDVYEPMEEFLDVVEVKKIDPLLRVFLTLS